MCSSFNPISQNPLTRNFAGAKPQVFGRNIYRGPHLFSDTPMIRIELDLGELELWPTNKIEGFHAGLVSLIPSIHSHTCSYDTAGGFLKRVEEGTWLGHVIEHIAIELQNLTGCSLSRGKTRSIKGRPGCYNVMYAYETEELGLAAGRYAIDIVNSLLPASLHAISGLEILSAEPPYTNINDALARLREIAGDERLGPTTRAIVNAAAARGIPHMRLDDQSMVQLGWGKHQRRIRASITDATSHIAVEAAGDKELTKSLLRAAGVPVPGGGTVRDVEAAIKLAQETGFPVVLKPLDGNHGRGVTTNIRNEDDVRRAFPLAQEHSPDVIVESFYSGRDFRVLLVDGKVVAVAERQPAQVIGDGRKTVAELIADVNADPRRGNGHEECLTKIIVDAHVEATLARAGLTMASVPSLGQQVMLRDTANLSTGGTAIDRTDHIHPANISAMERAARAIGLDICGIDVVATDIGRPLGGSNGGVVEVNAAPGFRMHLNPTEGLPRPVGEAVIEMMFPKGAPAQIPVIAITGTNGKSTTVRMIVNILRQGGANVGFTSTSGVFINDDVLWEGDASGPSSARMIFKDKTIDYAVLETARGGILREGLAFEACDVGAVLNVTEDHIGLKGINSVQDLADVKSVVTESVRRTGVSVLNADDPLTRAMAEHAGGKVCYFSMNGGNLMSDELRHHVNAGGLAVVRENWVTEDQLVIHADGRRIPIMSSREIPATLGGVASFNIQNALAAAAIAFAAGLDAKAIKSGLASFSSSFEQNPGRMNIYDGHDFRVILDYAHNPAALSSLGAMAQQLHSPQLRKIAMVSTPGDRRDEDIRTMGRIAAEKFDFLVFREDPDRRGRPPGEVLRLLTEGAYSAGMDAHDVVCVATEQEAIDICLREAQARELVLIMPTDIEGSWQRVINFKPVQSEGSMNRAVANGGHLNA